MDHDKNLKFYDFERKIDEFEEKVEALWKKYDVSGDEVLDIEEAKKFFQDMLKHIGLEHIEQAQGVLAGLIDENKDGVITKLEIRTLLTDMI